MIVKVEKMNMRQENHEEVQETKPMVETRTNQNLCYYN
jgi:hypothetical protein